MIKPPFQCNSLMKFLLLGYFFLAFFSALGFNLELHRFHYYVLSTILTVSICFLFYVGRRRLLARQIPEEQITRVKSSPGQVSLHLKDGSVKKFCSNFFELENLRTQLSGVLTSIEAEENKKLESGGSLTIYHRHSPTVAWWCGIGILLGFVSPWLLLIPMIVIGRYLYLFKNLERVTEIYHSGFLTNKDEFFRWEEVDSFAQADHGAVGVGDRGIILNLFTQGEGWLISRLAQRRTKCGMIFLPCGSRWFKKVLNRHAQFVGNA